MDVCVCVCSLMEASGPSGHQWVYKWDPNGAMTAAAEGGVGLRRGWLADAHDPNRPIKGKPGQRLVCHLVMFGKDHGQTHFNENEEVSPAWGSIRLPFTPAHRATAPWWQGSPKVRPPDAEDEGHRLGGPF